jgi:DNA gyrase inhibitor GyrI
MAPTPAIDHMMSMRLTFRIAGLCAGALALSIALAGPLMSQVETPRYTVTRAEGPIEVRMYPPRIVASVDMQGSREASISGGFRILAGYIFGGNEGSKKIEMTAPVMQQSAGVDPAETGGAAGSRVKGGSWKVRFLMPSAWSLATLPKAKDDRVVLANAPAATFAVIRFSGLARATALKTKTDELMAFVKTNKLAPQGQPIFAFYNPPWTLPFLRRNEVMIEVKL